LKINKLKTTSVKLGILLVLGISFHLLIAITMGLISFGMAMIAALILYLRPFEKEFSFPFVQNFFIKIQN